MIAPAEHTIVVSSIGPGFDKLIEPIRTEVKEIFGYKTEILSILEDIDFALDKSRNQFHSTQILEELAIKAPSQAFKVLGITDQDLFIPILTHVYGEAQIGGVTCIISTNRLKEGLLGIEIDKTFRKRVVKEAIHELGHTFKLLHCKERTCIMHYCRTIEDVDRKTTQLCRYCRVLLDDEKKRLAKEFSL